MERVVVMPTKERALCVELHGDVTRLITADEPMGVSATKTARALMRPRAVLSVATGRRQF
jgi:hypothetical protein